MNREVPGREVKSTTTSLQIIEKIIEVDGATLTQIANQLELGKSTVLNHLGTLERKNYVVKEGVEYHISLKFLLIGEYARNRRKEFELASDYVRELASKTNEEVDFAVEEHGRMITIAHAVGESFSKVTESDHLYAGRPMFMHNTAVGKAALAELPEVDVIEIIDRWGLPKETTHTITVVEELFEELDETRERGYAINDEELMSGFRAIGATVTIEDEPIASFSIGGPKYRINEGTIPDYADELRTLTTEFEQELQSDDYVLPRNWVTELQLDF